MGYYRYDLDEFRKYLRHVDNPVFSFTLSEGEELPFNSRLPKKVEQYLSVDTERFIYIYGGYYTWSATAVASTGNTDSKIFNKERSSHRTRISNMPKKQKEEIYRTLKSYLQ